MSTGSETAPNQAENPVATHQVLINDEEQYCLWPLAKAVPSGWRSVFSGKHEDCVAHVDRTWIDMRPKSVRA
ncbi:MbtH family protein [Nisaea denitrificans]|uniref:MbtH family protein n=1 Tax=Nisaea denitrificans TaxID=390877 RepID=UPI0004133DA1|nr:MbtH family protein [Nisaea denitrificans]